MGNFATRENLYLAINAADELWITQILERKPDLVNEPLTDDGKTNAITRACYCGLPHIILHLIKHGADLNRAGSSSITGLMWAAARGHLDCCKILVEFGANIDQTGPHGMNALDFAVLHGNYPVAFYLSTRGLRPIKVATELEGLKEEFGGRYTDYACLLMSLECKIPPEVAPSFTVPPPKKLVPMVDPVSDPREPWKDWMKRVIDFEEPPLVERHALPPDLQPQNTTLGKLKTFMGLENPPLDSDPTIPIHQVADITLVEHSVQKALASSRSLSGP